MVQEIIALFIVVLAAAYSIHQTIIFFRNLNNNQMCNCGGCHSKELQDIIKKSKKNKIISSKKMN